MSGYLEKMAEKGFEELIFVNDAKAGLQGIVAIHSTVRGPALGGTRMWNYASETEALDDVMHLARGMSYKAAAAELPAGGAKGVIIGDPKRDKTRDLFCSYGRFVNRLNGRFCTGKDMGINEDDLDCMLQECSYIIGGSEIGSPSPFTAFGVWRGMKACAESAFGSPELKDIFVAVQGAGSVGYELCRLLVEEGARVCVTDIDEGRLMEVVDKFGVEKVSPDEIYDVPCQIFSPCGPGGVVNDETLPRLKCKVIAGAANNVFKENRFGRELHERGILYAPDYVINAGGLVFVEMQRRGIKDAAEIYREVDRIEGRLRDLFSRSKEENVLPAAMADIIAEERLQA